ncbi:MAG: hypothetical protein JO181_10640, partial [Solirubrobacterales bacterium]|nr:hypothetical protein [Solirubrobacterales bacterium]
IVSDAQALGMQVDFSLTGLPPMWASGRGAPRHGRYPEWKPSAADYGAFVRAIATRYSGQYTPPGSASPLPRVRFWELWNEPNFGQNLAPQAIRGSTVSVAPWLYRNLVDAGWSALQATGHAGDTILLGSLDARGQNGSPSRVRPEGLPGNFGATKPLQFIRTLYCVDSSYREFRGAAAAAVGCPSTAAGSRQFRSAHPALFTAGGYAVHPYPVNLPPTQASSTDPDFVEFSELPRFGAALDRLQRTYGSTTRFPIWVNEYSYITNPPNNSGNHFVSPATAAYYINWAEYLSWRNPRIASTMQYLLDDPNPRHAPEYGGFASGLQFYNGRPKQTLAAYRLPLYLPQTAARRGGRLEVWGCVRPAHYASIDTGGQAQRVQIQFQRGPRGPWSALTTVPIADPHGYFDLRVAFPSSGSVRLAWSYPTGSTVFSRIVKVTVR